MRYKEHDSAKREGEQESWREKCGDRAVIIEKERT